MIRRNLNWSFLARLNIGRMNCPWEMVVWEAWCGVESSSIYRSSMVHFIAIYITSIFQISRLKLHMNDYSIFPFSYSWITLVSSPQMQKK